MCPLLVWMSRSDPVLLVSPAFLRALLASAHGTNALSEKLCQWRGHCSVTGLCDPVLFAPSPEALPTVKSL